MNERYDLDDLLARVRAGEVPAAPRGTAAVDYSGLLRQVREPGKSIAQASLNVSASNNADVEGEKIRLSRDMKAYFNEDWAPAAIDVSEAKRRLSIARGVNAMDSAPKLTQNMVNPNFANIAHDDLKNMSDTERTLGGTLGDVGVTALKGGVGVLQAISGWASLQTLGYSGKALEDAGVNFDEWQKRLEGKYSPAQQAAEKRVESERGFFNTAAAAVMNPSVIATTVGESLPQMFGGALIARGILGLGAKALAPGLAGPALPSWLSRTVGEKLARPIALGAGEGIMGMGSAAEQIRGQTEDRLLTPLQSFAAVGSGVGTGLLGFAGARVAQRFGFADIDAMILKGGVQGATAGALKQGFFKSLAKAGFTEGVLEELPQSAQEQMWQNFALDRPLFDGVPEAAAMGMVAGITTGGVAQTISYASNRKNQIDRAEQGAAIIEQLNLLSQASKVRERDTEIFSDWIKEASVDGPIENLYIEANVLRQSGIAEQLAAISPSVRNQLANAELGGEIVIPTSEYMTHIAPTPLSKQIIDDLRLEGEDMTRRQAQVAIQGITEEMKAASESIIAKQENQDAFVKSAKEVETIMFDQLKATQVYPDSVARVNAQFVRDMFVVKAAEMGMTPAELYAAMPYRVVREGEQVVAGVSGGSGALLNQPEFSRGDVSQHQMMVERQERILGVASRISAGERVAIDKAAQAATVAKVEIERQIRDHKLAHPTIDGWAPLEFAGITLDDKGGYELNYKTVKYQFDEGADGKPLKSGTPEYDARTLAIAKSIRDAVLSVYERAKAGDKNAANIIRQAGWYKEMRSRLRHEFGGLGDLFADLLGATSPNTPVRGNWQSAVDLLRRASRGDFDELMPKWVEWSSRLEVAEIEFAAWFNGQVAAGRSKANIKDEGGFKAWALEQKKSGLSKDDIQAMPEYQGRFNAWEQEEYQQRYARVAALRELPEDLMPHKESGAKYGFNGKHAVRAMLNLWRVVRDPNADIGIGGTAPKALNFSGNLIGFREKATIDIWAARLLQRLAGKLRIPNIAEGAVSGKMLSSGKTTLAFGFGQEVFTKAVKEIRADPEMGKDKLLKTINDDDLQAIVWFLEKEVWTRNDWTSAAGEGGSFEYEADLTGQQDQDRIDELRRIADSSALATDEQKAAARLETEVLVAQRATLREQRDAAKKVDDKKAANAAIKEIAELDKAIGRQKRILDAPGPEAVRQRREQALAELNTLTRSVDRFWGALSIQQSAETQGIDFVPTDADMARLGEDIRTSIYEADDGATVLGSKALSTEGRYGAPERSLDLEVVARAGFDPLPLWLKMLKAAQGANQDSTFLTRALRHDEDVDFQRHRPGVEIYFRNAAAIDKLQPILDDLATRGIEFYTVIVDGKRSPGAVAGGMPPAVGVRFQLVPEMNERYGLDDFKWSDLTADEIATKIKEQADALERLAATVAAGVDGVSFAERLWYETEVAFKNQYQEKIDAVTNRIAQGERGSAGTGVWSGQSVREGVEGAAFWARESERQGAGAGAVQPVGGMETQPSSGDQGTLKQGKEGGARGGFDPSRLTAILNEKTDFTTFAHETSHFYVEMLMRMAAMPQATAQIKADADTLLEFFKVPDINTWNGLSVDEKRKAHESFAYNYEIYLFEGKAPSIKQQSMFDKFSAWLRRAYKSIRDDLNAIYKAENGVDLPILTGEVRQIMDRMLASDEQIKQAEQMRNMMPMFQTQQDSGMDDGQWAAYQEMVSEARNASVTDLTKATLRQMKWLSNAESRILKDIQKTVDDTRKAIRLEAAEEVRNLPVYRAMEYLKRGVMDGKPVDNPLKLSIPEIEAMYGDNPIVGAIKKALGFGKYGMLANENAIHPEQAAELFDFPSADAMVRALLEAKPLKDAINDRTDQRMLEEHSEMSDPKSIELAVDEALHNEARARFVAVELRHLAKATEPVRLMLQAAKQVAKAIITGKIISQIKPRDYSLAEARAAKQATDFMKKGKSEEAVQAKRNQLVQNQLAAEAVAARREVDKAVEGFRKFFRSDANLAKTRNMDLVDAARSILAYYGLGQKDKNPVEYIEKLRAYNPELFAEMEPLIIEAASGSKNYTDLTLEEFRTLRDSVEALWFQAKRENEVMIEGKAVAINEIVAELNTRLEVIGIPEEVPGERAAPTTKDRAVRQFYAGKAITRRVEHWADATDGPTGPGAFTKYIWRPVRAALDAYRTDRNIYVKRYVELIQGLDLPVGKIAAPEINYTFGDGNGGIGKAELIGALLHTGNASNLKKLLLGRGWATQLEDGSIDMSSWRAFEQRMISEGKLTKADYDFAQAVWDLNEELKPMAQEAHKDIFGYYFKEVEASPLSTPFGDYRGGYVPAKTDPFIVRDAQRQAKMEELESDFRQSMPSTGMGFTKGRVEYNKPLSLDVRLGAKHIDDVIRFAHVQPAIKDALKILRKRDFADNLTRVDPTVLEDMLIPWLNRSARQITSEPGKFRAMDTFWSGVRTRTGISIMFANVTNALQQLTGYFPALLKVKATYLKSALFEYMGNSQKVTEEVAELSLFMADRLRNQVFDMQDAMNQLLLNPSHFDKVQAWAKQHGYFLQSAFQNQVDVVTWTATFNQTMAESGKDATDKAALRESVLRADAAVRLTQSSLSPEDVAAFEVGTPFYKTFIQFTGYFNMLANLNSNEFIKVIRDLGWRGNKGKLGMIYVLGFAMPMLIADAIVRSLGGGWDDEDDDGYLDEFAEWFFGSQAKGAAALVPFGAAAATALTTAFNNKAYDDRMTTSPSVSTLEAATIGVGKTVINVVSDDKEVTGRNVRDVLTLLSLVTGIPVTVLGRPIGYAIDVERGKIDPTSKADYVRGLVTGKASELSKQ